jgi:hypothetical protein
MQAVRIKITHTAHITRMSKKMPNYRVLHGRNIHVTVYVLRDLGQKSSLYGSYSNEILGQYSVTDIFIIMMQKTPNTAFVIKNAKLSLSTSGRHGGIEV